MSRLVDSSPCSYQERANIVRLCEGPLFRQNPNHIRVGTWPAINAVLWPPGRRRVTPSEAVVCRESPVRVAQSAEERDTCMKRVAYLDHASAHPRFVQEVVAQAEQLCTPVHHDLLQFRACWTTKPLFRAPSAIHVQCDALSRTVLTLKPGLETLEEYRSPMMPSKLQAVGKYAKKLGCCQCVRPGGTMRSHTVGQVMLRRGKTYRGR